MIEFVEKDGCLIFTLRVVPRSSKSEIVGEIEGNLKVRISAPPVDGAANVEVIKLIAKAFGVGRSSVAILSGETSKTKRISVEGGSATLLQQLAAE